MDPISVTQEISRGISGKFIGNRAIYLCHLTKGLCCHDNSQSSKASLCELYQNSKAEINRTKTKKERDDL